MSRTTRSIPNDKQYRKPSPGMLMEYQETLDELIDYGFKTRNRYGVQSRTSLVGDNLKVAAWKEIPKALR